MFVYIFVFFILGRIRGGSSITVTLTIPQHIQKGEVFRVNCSTLVVPAGRNAEFLKNGVTLTNIRIYNNVCFDTVVGTACQTGLCQCYDDGKTYSIYQKAMNAGQSDTFSCKMTFAKNVVEYSNNATIYVHESPKLSVKKKSLCNDSDTVTLVCTFKGINLDFYFGHWTHSFSDTFVRELEGIEEDNILFLLLKPCSLQNIGNYSCKGWYLLSENITWIEATVEVSFPVKPVILEKTTYKKKDELQYSILFYTKSEVEEVAWYQLPTGKLENSTIYLQCLSEIPTKINVHGQLVQVIGYQSRLVSKDYSDKPMQICIKNEFGNICDTLNYEGDRTGTFNILWIMIGVISVILTTGCITVMSTIYAKRRNKDDIKQGENTASHRTHCMSEQRELQSASNNHVVSSNVPDNQYLRINPYEHDVHYYERSTNTYQDLFPYQTERITHDRLHNYLEIQQESDTISKRSGQYEEVE